MNNTQLNLPLPTGGESPSATLQLSATAKRRGPKPKYTREEKLARLRVRNMLPHIKARREKQRIENRKDPIYLAECRRKSREYFKRNKAKVYAYRKMRPDIYKEATRHYTRKWQRDRRNKDPQYRVGNRLRSRLWHALAAQGVKKALKTVELVGCSIAELRKHIEGLFTEGMGWQNIGEWHIDHKTPCASFDLSDLDQQKRCFHFSNLQPLWATDNLSKGDKIIFPKTA